MVKQTHNLTRLLFTVRNLEDQADPALLAIQIETAILAHLKNKRTNLKTNHQAKTRAQHPQLT